MGDGLDGLGSSSVYQRDTLIITKMRFLIIAPPHVNVIVYYVIVKELTKDQLIH